MLLKNVTNGIRTAAYCFTAEAASLDRALRFHHFFKSKSSNLYFPNNIYFYSYNKILRFFSLIIFVSVIWS